MSEILSSCHKEVYHDKSWLRKKIVNCFFRIFWYFVEFSQVFLQGCQNMHCKCQKEHLEKYFFPEIFIHFRRRARNLIAELYRTFLRGLYKLHSGHRGERFDEKPISETLIFAQFSSDFDQNCFLISCGKIPAH